MKILGGMTIVLATLLMTGCAAASGDSAAESTPTETRSANLDACRGFSQATASMETALTGDGNTNEAWAGVRDQMDTAELAAEGDVKIRLQTLVENWPRAADLIVYRKFDSVNTMINDVARACSADDAEVVTYTFQPQ